MSEIARLANVSVSTVSRAMADNPSIGLETRQRVQELARMAGYTVDPAASSLRTRQSKVIAVAIPLFHARDQHLSDPFMMAMLAYLAEALTARGLNLLLTKVSTHEDGWVEHLFRTQRPAGAIVIGQSLDHQSIDRAARKGVPLVVWGARLDGQSYATVGSDNREGGYIATRHLIERGRRRIALFGPAGVPEIDQRREGYLRAHQDAGLTPDVRLEVRGGFSPAETYNAAQRLLASGADFDGVVSGSDVIAMSVMSVFSEAGRATPEDIAVVGFDDVELAAYCSPALTTVRQDLARGANLLVEKVIGAAAGQSQESVEMPVELIVRGST